MATFNYIKALRDRLILLIERHSPTAEIKVNNRSKRDDTARTPAPMVKGAKAPADFPELIVRASDGTDPAYSDPQTFGDEADDGSAAWEVPVSQSFELTLTHDDFNEDENNALELEVKAAIRRGGLKLADPNNAGSTKLAYVLAWGPITERRTDEDVRGKIRPVVRFTVPITMQLSAAAIVS